MDREDKTSSSMAVTSQVDAPRAEVSSCSVRLNPPVIPRQYPVIVYVIVMFLIYMVSAAQSSNWFWVCIYLWIPMAARKTDHKDLTITESALVFSNDWSDCVFGRLERCWDDVHSITASGLENWDIANWKKRRRIFDPSVTYKILIDFKSGGQVDIELERLTRAKAIDLVTAIKRWADPSLLSSSMVTLQHALLSVATDGTDFTQLWITDLNSRYSSTQFATLRNGHSLQDGQYRIVTQLAGSGLSAVYLATSGESKVVIKETCCPSTTNDAVKQKAHELLEREARVLCKLSHSQISRVIDFFVDSGRSYLVIEYVSGASLRQIVATSGRQTVTVVLDWAQQLASILRYIHSHDPPVIHRDITPDNIIVRPNGQIVLVDFGACNEFIGTVTGTLIGKQSYMPPEQFRGKAVPPSDIFALGMTLFFLLTAIDPEPLSQARLCDTLPEFDSRWDAFIANCTALSTSERISSAEELAQRLATLAGTTGV